MYSKRAASCGSWTSPLHATAIAQGGLRLSDVRVQDGEVYWIEGRPNECGRCVVVKYCLECGVRDITPSGFNVRTAVHEYGGGAFAVHGKTIFFSNWEDSRIYRQAPSEEPIPISSDTVPGIRSYYADFEVSPDGSMVFCIRESWDKGSKEPSNDLVTLAADGSADIRSIVSGRDFFSSPRVSPDGRRLAWLTWNHPNMPWDSTELWVGDLSAEGTISTPTKVAGTGNSAESVIQPEWHPDGTLYFVSDKTGWWNLYRWEKCVQVPVFPSRLEWAEPAWVFGMSRYSFLSDGSVIAAPIKGGSSASLGVLRNDEDVGDGVEFVEIPSSYTEIAYLRGEGGSAYFIGTGINKGSEVASYDFNAKEAKTLKKPANSPLATHDVSYAEIIKFPTSESADAWAFFYRPASQNFKPLPGEKPPLIVISHGGPTSASGSSFNEAIQFWTSRGFAVVDVNYRGSSGYGRTYRNSLRGNWGIYDVNDCIAAAQFLTGRGDVDGTRVAIRGGSAGGYTTLCALVFHSYFAAGASYYGVADTEALALKTHKFESRYLDKLIAPYPSGACVYKERSPIRFSDRLSCPVILFQGDEDKIVPPEQAERMAASLERLKLPYAYILFEGEQHGFRKEETVRLSLEAELYFYGRIFGFEPADDVKPVEIMNLP